MIRGGELIKLARKARGMTQLELAFAHGPALKTIQRWECCSTPIPFDDVIWIITDIFKMTITEAMELAPDEKH
jgi:transcriptional regulator with XRE-family HTH domain|tara:strand:+ start:14950 stop:15168 length:219 start_codon:yes stop_codon:yes gene_type:complete